jgi:ATP-dependent DNA helicase RecG
MPPVQLSPSEYENVENKQSLAEQREIVETVAAFATASGGTVYVGVRPDGSRVGVQLGRNTLENLANEIKRNTDPPQYPSIVVEGEEQSAVLCIRVPENPVKPVWAYGRPFKRVGRTNQSLSADETRRLMDLTRGRSWDSLVCPDLRREDIDRRAITDFLHRSDQRSRISTEAVLDNLGFITGGGLSRAAALLFAKNPQKFIPGAEVKCARFKGTTSIDFLDQQTFRENLLFQVEAAQSFISRNTKQAIRITGQPEREVVPEYPLEAIREAIANAICHRDYAATGTVQIRIYEDRLEVWNPGTLPPELTVEDLYREHASKPRNLQLADAMFRSRLIEQWGTGTLRIVQACLNQGLPRPEFEAKMVTFIVRFNVANPSVIRDPSAAFGPQERKNFLRHYLRGHQRITRNVYQDLLKISSPQARRDLKTWADQALLEKRNRSGDVLRFKRQRRSAGDMSRYEQT